MSDDKEIPIWKVSVPGYTTNKTVDYENIGKKLDKIIKQNFLGKKVLIRCVGSKDHVGLKIDELIDTIKKIGTDRYDPERKMIFHDFYSKHNPDLFASPYTVTETTPSMRQLIEEFYEKTTGDRKIGIRADVILVYDPRKLKMIKHVYENQDWSDCFTFKYPENKRESLLGVIQIVSK